MEILQLQEAAAQSVYLTRNGPRLQQVETGIKTLSVTRTLDFPSADELGLNHDDPTKYHIVKCLQVSAYVNTQIADSYKDEFLMVLSKWISFDRLRASPSEFELVHLFGGIDQMLKILALGEYYKMWKVGIEKAVNGEGTLYLDFKG
jgi:hypothetical protein